MKPNKPVRGQEDDYRCFQANEDCEDKNCDTCDDRDNCTSKGYQDLTSITLAELIEAYKGYDTHKVEIHAIDSEYPSLSILRPETDEEFNTRVIQYEKDMAEYNRWLLDNTPEKKKERKKLKQIQKLAALKKKVSEMEQKDET
jgi:hypothetical protein